MFSFRTSLTITMIVLFCVFAFSFMLTASPALAAPYHAVTVQSDDTPEVPPVDDATSAFIHLSVLVAGLVETVKRVFIKPIAERDHWPDYHYNRVIYALAVLLGIGAAVVAGPGVDFFALIGIEGLPRIIGVIAYGVMISFGENFAHYALDAGRSGVNILRSWSNGSSVTVKTETTALAPTTSALGEFQTLLETLRNFGGQVPQFRAQVPISQPPPIPQRQVPSRWPDEPAPPTGEAVTPENS